MKRIIRLFNILSLVILSLAQFSCGRKSAEAGEACLKMAYDKLANDSIGEAFVLANNALDGFEATNDSVGVNCTRVFMAMLYNITAQHEQATAMVGSINPSRLPQNVYMQNFLRLQSYYATEFDKALVFSDSLICLDHRLGECEAEVLDQLNKVEMLMRYGQNDWAKALIDSISPKDTSMLAVMPIWHARKAQLHFISNRLDSAYRHAELAVESDNAQSTDMDSRMMARTILMRIDSINGNIERYASNRNVLDAEQRTIQAEDVNNRIAILKANETLERLKIKTDYKERQHVYVVIIIAAFIALLVTLAIWKYRSMLAEQKIVKLTCDALDVEVFRYKMKNELLSEKVKSLNDKVNEANEAHASKLNDDEGMSYLDILRKRLRNEHGDYMQQVRKAFPDLSPNEELLIGFIKMDLTTAEITKALNIEPRSLIKSRYRLRKKLGVENADELNNFIRSIGA